MKYLSCLQEDFSLLLLLLLLLQLVQLLKELQLSPNVTDLLIVVILLPANSFITRSSQKTKHWGKLANTGKTRTNIEAQSSVQCTHPVTFLSIMHHTLKLTFFC